MSIDETTIAWLRDRFWADDELLTSARAAFAEVGPMIEVPNETGALLASLVRTSGAARVVEVGTLFGYSTVWMARALPPDGHLDTLEIDDAHADAAQRLFDDAGLADRITIHRGPGGDSLASLDGPYDLAFIDADKTGYPAYLERLLEIMRPGGVILADNIAQAGRTADPAETSDNVAAIRRYLELATSDSRLDTNVLPIGDGVALSVVCA